MRTRLQPLAPAEQRWGRGADAASRPTPHPRAPLRALQDGKPRYAKWVYRESWDPAWKSNPRYKTVTEMKESRRKADQPHHTFDVDGDGTVGSYVRAPPAHAAVDAPMPCLALGRCPRSSLAA